MTAPAVMNRSQSLSPATEFIDTAGCGFDEKVDPETRSTYNEEEAQLLVKNLSGLVSLEEQVSEMSIGIIAPYRAQVEQLTSLLADTELLSGLSSSISINSVDSFQGQERDIIYISLTRSNDKGEIGFLKDLRRTNVALTRARYKLVVIGDSATLGSHDFYSDLVEHFQSQGGYRSAFELM